MMVVSQVSNFIIVIITNASLGKWPKIIFEKITRVIIFKVTKWMKSGYPTQGP